MKATNTSAHNTALWLNNDDDLMDLLDSKVEKAAQRVCSKQEAIQELMADLPSTTPDGFEWDLEAASKIFNDWYKTVTNYESYKAARQAEADAWMEAHADEMYEDERGHNKDRLVFGHEFFDMDAAEASDYDDLSYYEKMGIYAVTPKKQVRYVVQPEHTPAPTHHKYVEATHANIYSDDLDDCSILMRGVQVEVLPYRGQPVASYRGKARAPKAYAAVISEGRAREAKKRTTRMDRLRAKADRKSK